jgi:lipopolysaccharide/colanic/teichoic acid biosynthesis glycosyltransferase
MISRQIIALHNQFGSRPDLYPKSLRIMEAGERVSRILLDGFKRSCSFADSRDTVFVMPRSFRPRASSLDLDTCYDDETLPAVAAGSSGRDSWTVISNGNCIAACRPETVQSLITQADVDVITINVETRLQANREVVRLTSSGEIVGIRRAFFDSIMPDHLPCCWPSHTLIRTRALAAMQEDGRVPLRFPSFLALCVKNMLRWQPLKVGGSVLDLETEAGLLDFVAGCLAASSVPLHRGRLSFWNGNVVAGTCRISPSARLFGQVVLGPNVQVDDDVIIIGPALIGDGVRIRSSAAVCGSVLCPGISVPERTVIRRRIVGITNWDAPHGRPDIPDCTRAVDQAGYYCPTGGTGVVSPRMWPRLSYAGLGKRACDIIASLAGLLLLAPLLIITGLLVRWTSAGPVLFRHRREGLRGREFDCLKFRTMVVGADELQDRLRARNEVDGPQFKVSQDPRVTVVGRLLRDTYIDELPQLVNVLLGHMSLIGPRPSPRAENRLCATWREARLSVRPGISGLWQVSRTRRSGQDFQEWIHFDIEYVRNMSFRQDLLIFVRTIRKLVSAMIRRV